MTYYRDLREYLQALEKAGDLIRIRRKINKDTELMPFVRLQYRGLPEENRKAFLFENLFDLRGNQYSSPVAVGVLAGSSRIYALGMACDLGEIGDKMTKAALHPLQPKIVASGPVQEEIHMGDALLEHCGLDEFPIPISTPGYDATPAMSAPVWITKDPETGIRNAGMYRALVKSRDRTGICMATPTRGIAIHWNKCRARGQALPAAIVIGGPPAVGYVSVTDFPVDTDELMIAGAIAGDPLEVVKCKTIDIEVPAHAEIVIEGEVSNQNLEPEGPFGESFGIMSLSQPRPYFTVRCITHRRNPIWLAFISQLQPSESSKIKYHGNCSAIFKHLRHDLKFEKVKKVSLHELGGASFFAVVQVKKPEPGEVWQILQAVIRYKKDSKTVIAVDEDINPDDLEMVVFSLSHRFQPHRDLKVITQPAEGFSDCSLAPMEDLDKLRKSRGALQPPDRSFLLIDATMKWPYPPLSLPKKEYMERALQLWEEEGLPKLSLRQPVWGRNLGYWSKENEVKAERAMKGEYYKNGEEEATQRVPLRAPSSSGQVDFEGEEG